jgi:hypothetical protein
MKKLATLAVLMAFVSAAQAGTTCRKDFMGNTVCTSDDGYTTTQRQDFMGNQRITDNYGNSVTCRKDFMGNTRCD